VGESNDLTEQQMVFLDPFLLDRARIQAGLSLGELANKSDLNYRTVKKGVFLQGGLLPANAKAIADTLGCDVLDLLAPCDPRYVLPKSASPWLGEAEWERVPLSRARSASGQRAVLHRLPDAASSYDGDGAAVGSSIA
jgi:hypothetical protein